MALARYTYLPWLRRGVANAIGAEATVASRASIEVSLAVNDGAATGLPIVKTFQLAGPGDVLGISPDLVVRTEPRAWVTDFEPNYLAFVEFYDEDFPWRHTPKPADTASHRLDPWLSLLVLEEGEFDRNLAPGRPLTSVKVKSPDLASYFPKDDQVWAWAHCQIAGEVGGGDAPDAALLTDRLLTTPDAGVSRLLSPRRLTRNTAYTAFVVPTFEAGRKAGLGVKFDDPTESGVRYSWTGGDGEFPVYYEWSFRTGEGGDFEDLVERITPRPVDSRVGVRAMDIAAPGFGMAPLPTPGDPDEARTVGLEGALKSPTMERDPTGSVGDVSRFPAEVASLVNAPAIAQASGDGDPVIAPPLIGGWAALVDKVDPGGVDQWVGELNLDPRSRAAGGLGGRVVRQNQERYMKLAWEQVGEVLAANRKAAFLRFSQAAAQKAFTATVVQLPREKALAIAAPAFARILGSPTTLRAQLSASRLPDAALSAPFRKLTRARGLAMRRALPPAQASSPLADLVRALNEGKISAAPAPPPVTGPTLDDVADAVAGPIETQTAWARRAGWWVLLLAILALLAFIVLPGVAGLVLAAALVASGVAIHAAARQARNTARAAAGLRITELESGDIAASAPAGFALATPGQAPAAADAAEGRDFGEALRAFVPFVAARPAPAPIAAAFDSANAHAKMLSSLSPRVAYPRRAASLIRIGDRSILDYVGTAYPSPPSTDDGPQIAPVLAYPDIKDPMYGPLRDLSSDLLIPNLGLIPPNTISMMLTNPRFIEAYMAGLNHEFARELLWREYPTDCRGSPFRQFWDVSATPTLPGIDPAERARLLKDIRPLHEWPVTSALGNNANPGRELSGESVVLVLRGDLLKRYPNTLVYAQRAVWSGDPRHVDELVLYDEVGEKALAGVDDPNIAYPVFTAQISTDLTFVGFRLGLEEVRGDPTLEETAQSRQRLPAYKLGWFIALQEIVGEPRLGFDEHAPPPEMASDVLWDNLAWDNINMDNRKLIDLAPPFKSQPAGQQPAGAALNWAPAAGSTAADIAAILNQKPVLVAWHARQMLARGQVD